MNALMFVVIICASIVLTQDPRRSAKHYCYVQSPNDLSIFNLTTIQHDDIDSTVRIKEFEHLRVHFCRPLKDPCNGKQDYAVCLHTKDKEIGVGKEPPKVAIQFGKIMFRYIGDRCNKTHNYTVDVEMKCNLSNKEKLAADLDILYNRDQCSFQMSIESFSACSKRKQAKCEFSDKTGYYNLRPLMNLGNNYIIKLSNSLSVILNVCHSLLYGEHFHECDHDTMVCLVEETNTQAPRYTRLGNVNDDMRFSTKNGTVHLDLTSDTPCNKEDDTRLKTIRTTIEFVCKEGASDQSPEYISGIGTCHYKFRWLTTAACSEDILIRISNLNHQPCKVLNLVNGLYYDFSTLAGNSVFVNSSDGKAEYQFSVCAPVQKSNCTKTGTGVCKYIKEKKMGVSKGLANSNLTWLRKYIFLNYTDGIVCGNNQRSYTVIIFECSRTNNSMIIDDHDPCATIITWTSPTICKCIHDMERVMDILSPQNLYHYRLLSRHHINYVIQGKSNATQYHLNVATPLVDDNFTICARDASICEVVYDDEGRKIKELNLGSEDSDARITKDGDMYLSYLNGSICEEDKSKRISSKITFTCDVEAYEVQHIYYGLDNRFPKVEFLIRFLRLLQGTPAFKRYNNCTYEFDWRSSIACLEHIPEMTNLVCFAEKVKIFNFTYLIKNSLFKVNEDESSGYFSARYCEDKNKCNGTFICDNWPYYRKGLTNKLDRTKPIVAFKFFNEFGCKNEILYKTVINMWCDLWAGIGELFVIKDQECSIGLDWDKYIHACEEPVTEKKKEKISKNLPPGNSNFLEKASFVILTTLGVILVLLVLTILSRYRRNIRRSLRRNSRRNYEKNIRYLAMRGSEPSVDFRTESEPNVDPDRESNQEVDVDMESDQEGDVDMESKREVDVDMEENRELDLDMESEPAVDLDMESEPAVDLDMESEPAVNLDIE